MSTEITRAAALLSSVGAAEVGFLEGGTAGWLADRSAGIEGG